MKTKKLAKTYFEIYTIGGVRNGWGGGAEDELYAACKTLIGAKRIAKIALEDGDDVKIKKVKEILFIKANSLVDASDPRLA